jgi:predicted metal-binding protein
MEREDRTPFMNKLYDKFSYSERKALHLSSKNWDIVSYWRFHKSINTISREFELFNEGCMAFGPGGGCRLCHRCEIHSGKACKKEQKSVFSPESCGVDLYSTLQNLKIPIEIPPRKVFTRIGMTFTNHYFNPITIENNHDYNQTTLKSPFEIGEAIEKGLLGKVIDCFPANNIFSENDFCRDCNENHRYICNRSFLPFEYLHEFLARRICLVLKFNSKKDLANNLWKWQQSFQRAGFYDSLSFANKPCWLCENCKSSGCTFTNNRKRNKFGKKELWRCIRYLSLNPENYQKDLTYAFLIMSRMDQGRNWRY